MYSLLYLFAVSFALSLALTSLVRHAFAHAPRNSPIPRVGGIAIAASYAGALLAGLPVALRAAGFIHAALPAAVKFLPAAALILATGIVDDLVGLRPWQKLAGQIAAASAAYWAGIHVTGFGGHVFAHWWSFPLTVLWLTLCTNAMNLIDGVDGLAAGVGLFAAATMLLAALLQDNFALAIAAVPLVGSLAAFLRYNFNPATIFLGDSGSLLLGFLLGCYGVMWSQKSATILGMTAPVLALSIPLLDTALTVGRRFLGRKSIFSGDRGHMHHRLLDRGFGPRRVALIFYGLCAVAAILSLWISGSRHLEALVIPVFCVGAWAGIQQLGYVEFGLAGRLVLDGSFRKYLGAQVSLRHYERLLNEAKTAAERWDAIRGAAREFGFSQARASLGGEEFRYDDGGEPVLTISVPLGPHDFIELARPMESKGNAAIAGPFAEMLRRSVISQGPPQSHEAIRKSAPR
jgi:UDP-GlcNAc:undecaprenyl-phosphate/decaprenyl-phosphate GlcNAc-1-phosphate transferase